MIYANTERDNVLADIMDFTATVVGIATMNGVENPVKAKAIFMAEQMLHQVIMDKIVEKCVESTTPSEN